MIIFYTNLLFIFFALKKKLSTFTKKKRLNKSLSVNAIKIKNLIKLHVQVTSLCTLIFIIILLYISRSCCYITCTNVWLFIIIFY